VTAEGPAEILRRSGAVELATAAGPAYSDMWFALDGAAKELAESDAEAARILLLLGQVCSLLTEPKDPQNPYEAFATWVDRRSFIPDDLTEEEVELLAEAAPYLELAPLRARVEDVLSLRSTGKGRLDHARAAVAAWIAFAPPEDDWFDFRDEWHRFAWLANRHASTLEEEREKISALLLGFVLGNDPSVAAQAAAVARETRLLTDQSTNIAGHLLELGNGLDEKRLLQRGLFAEATQWFSRDKNGSAAEGTSYLLVQSLIAEADERSSGARGSALVENGLLEEALRALRRIPKTRREELGAGGLARELERRIRESGQRGLSEMSAFRIPATDATQQITAAIEHVTGRSAVNAIRAFTDLMPFVNYLELRETTERLLANSPLQGLLSTVTFAPDGRAINRDRDPDAENRYGVPGNLWRQMIQTYQIRISHVVGAGLWQSYLVLSNEHRIGLGDFVTLVEGSGIVADGRVQLFARGLWLGFRGDFVAAMHLLVPQLESFVRLLLREAGEATSNVGQTTGAENERGLSALMESPRAVEILGEDIAFEVRALLCGPLGPNLRNEIAHGLIDDGSIGAATPVYLWWFALKLVFGSYDFRLQQEQAEVPPADEPEPGSSSEPDSGT
jgi:hypothetical protein